MPQTAALPGRLTPALALALLLVTGCSYVGEIGSWDEDPSLGQMEPEVEIVNPSGGEMLETAMPPCGTVLATFQGTAAFSNGPSTGTGYSCAGSTSYGPQFQCAELVIVYSTLHVQLGADKIRRRASHKGGTAVKYFVDIPRRQRTRFPLFQQCEKFQRIAVERFLSIPGRPPGVAQFPADYRHRTVEPGMDAAILNGLFQQCLRRAIIALLRRDKGEPVHGGHFQI